MVVALYWPMRNSGQMAHREDTIELQLITWASLILAVLYPFSENKFASFFLKEIGICLIQIHK